MVKTSEKIQQLLRTVCEQYDKEDSDVRQRQIRTWRRLKLLWEGIHRTWYSETAHDWRIWDQETQGDSDTQQDYYDKPVNVFRAYLESIIAALSVTVPPIKCYPDDAENTLDLDTARAGDKIAKLLYLHNDVPLLWLHALFIFCTEGLVGCHSEVVQDDAYGTYENPEYEDQDETHQKAICPNCGYELSDQVIPGLSDKLEEQEDKFSPDDSDIPIQDYISEDGTQDMCPACAQQIIPLLQKETLTITRLIGVTNEPKSRIKMCAYGGLNIKVPNYARNQSECPYLIYAYETHFVNAVERYAEGDLDSDSLREKIKQDTGFRDGYMEAWSRLSPQYNGAYPENVVTVKQYWIRPAGFNILDDEVSVRELKKKYPNGVRVSFVNDEFAEACNEALDDVWTLTYNPMSDFIHFNPLGLLLVSIQELTNDLISLTEQTIEQGVGQTFVDPETVNLNAYRQLEAIPGGMYEAKPKSGKALADSFHEMSTASLSPEILAFFNQLQSLGQLVSGALPSLFGGAVQGGGTASEYSMSRAQALQRLQNTWKMMTYWWKGIFGKAIPAYMKQMQEDERNVERTKDGSFINVFIHKAELEGKIGRIELEANENLPQTWNQRKDVIMQLIQTGVPEILQLMGAPENLQVIREAIGLDDFYIPGQDQVEKTYDDIKQLLNTEPMFDPEFQQEMPSIQPDPTYDDPSIAFEIIRKWVISEQGRQAKIDNAAGYRNVLLLGQGYKMLESQQAIPSDTGDGAPPNEKPKDSTQINGESDVPVTN